MERSLLSTTIERLIATTHTEDGWIEPLAVALDGVTATEAAWHPAPGVSSIWEITAHLSNYLNSHVGSYTDEAPVDFEDWPAVENTTDADWLELRDKTVAMSKDLGSKAAKLSDEDLAKVAKNREAKTSHRIVDISSHDAYHAGQIVKLRQIYAAMHPSASTLN